LSSFPEWSRGEFTPQLARERINWNESERAWIIQGVEDYAGDEVNGVADLVVWIQFRDGGAPVQHPGGDIDEMEVRMEGTNIGRYEGERFVAEYDWVLGFDFSATRVNGGAKHFTGGGSLTGVTEVEARGRDHARQQDLTWYFDLSAPQGSSCAEGFLSGNADDLTLAASFLEKGQVSWTVSRGTNVIRSGSTEYGCGAFKAKW
jgi:hypothetical protein